MDRSLETCHFEFLVSQYEEEAKLFKPVQAFECKTNVLAKIIYRVCKQFKLDREGGIPILAIQFVERYIESCIQELRRDSDLLLTIFSSIRIATKILTGDGYLQQLQFQNFYSFITKGMLFHAEISLFNELQRKNQLSRPNLMVCFEVLLSVGFPEALAKDETFREIGEKVLVVLTLNRFSLNCKLFQHQFGRNPASQADIQLIRMISRDHILMSAGTHLILLYKC